LPDAEKLISLSVAAFWQDSLVLGSEKETLKIVTIVTI